MKTKLFFAGAFATVAAISFYAFKPATSASCSYMEITTVESIIPGGLGRSKMLITDESGKTSDAKIENLYSMVGINFGNIQSNDGAVVNKLNSLAQQGWVLDHTTTGVQTPTEKSSEGIFLTRYFLKKQN